MGTINFVDVCIESAKAVSEVTRIMDKGLPFYKRRPKDNLSLIRNNLRLFALGKITERHLSAKAFDIQFDVPKKWWESILIK